jgi:hypothetical protein
LQRRRVERGAQRGFGIGTGCDEPSGGDDERLDVIGDGCQGVLAAAFAIGAPGMRL